MERSGSTRAHPRRGGGFLGLLAALFPFSPPAASAQEGGRTAALDLYLTALAALSRHELAALALTLGILAFAVLTAIMLVRSRARAEHAEAAARAEITTLKTGLDRAVTMLLSEPQVLVVWGPVDDEPEILGDTTIVTSVPIARRVLAFATWLAGDKARELDDAVAALRARGQGFSMELSTLAGRHIEAEGRAIGGRAVVRLKEVTGSRRALAELTLAHQRLLADVDTLRTLLETVPLPIWARDAGGKLVWVNPAYARAVEAKDASDAIDRGQELLERSARDDLLRAREDGKSYRARVPVIVAGERRVFDVLDLPAREGSAGIGIDATEVEMAQAKLAHMIDAHRRTLDQLPTAVAIFAADQRLTFCNAAYRTLWDIDSGLPRPGAFRRRRARPAARRPQAAGAGRFPPMAKPAA